MAIEDPNVVLISAASAQLFDGTKTVPLIDEFISKRNAQVTVRKLNSRGEQEGFACPAKVRRRLHALLTANDFISIRRQLEFDLHLTALARKCRLVVKCGITMLDARNTSMDRAGRRAKRAGLSVEYPFAREVGLLLRDH